jgi:hypothetical protein
MSIHPLVEEAATISFHKEIPFEEETNFPPALIHAFHYLEL